MGDFTPRIDGGRDGSGVDGSRDAGFTGGGAEGSAVQANRHQSVTNRLSVDPSRSMKAVTGEVEELLEGLVSDPIADWGAFLLDRLADRWGLDGGSQRIIWAEIDTSA